MDSLHRGCGSVRKRDRSGSSKSSGSLMRYLHKSPEIRRTGLEGLPQPSLKPVIAGEKQVLVGHAWRASRCASQAVGCWLMHSIAFRADPLAHEMVSREGNSWPWRF